MFLAYANDIMCQSAMHFNPLFQMLLLLLLSHFSHVRLCNPNRRQPPQAPLSLVFSRQEHWSGLPLPSLIVSNIIGLKYLF